MFLQLANDVLVLPGMYVIPMHDDFLGVVMYAISPAAFPNNGSKVLHRGLQDFYQVCFNRKKHSHEAAVYGAITYCFLLSNMLHLRIAGSFIDRNPRRPRFGCTKRILLLWFNVLLQDLLVSCWRSSHKVRFLIIMPVAQKV